MPSPVSPFLSPCTALTHAADGTRHGICLSFFSPCRGEEKRKGNGETERGRRVGLACHDLGWKRKRPRRPIVLARELSESHGLTREVSNRANQSRGRCQSPSADWSLAPLLTAARSSSISKSFGPQRDHCPSPTHSHSPTHTLFLSHTHSHTHALEVLFLGSACTSIEGTNVIITTFPSTHSQSRSFFAIIDTHSLRLSLPNHLAFLRTTTCTRCASPLHSSVLSSSSRHRQPTAQCHSLHIVCRLQVARYAMRSMCQVQIRTTLLPCT